MSHEFFFLAHLETIEGTIALIGRRNRLRADDAEEFRSLAFIKLIENDYEILRRFEQRSSLRTYLAVVLQRMFLDHRTSQWGKWRPSAEARRLGPVAIDLERLLIRDGLPLEEAIHVLVISRGATESPEALRDLAARFPARRRRRAESDDSLSEVPDRAPLPDDQAAREDLRGRAGRAKDSLDRAIASLPVQDQLIIKLCFWDRLTIAEIARMCEWEQKPLYRRLQHALTALRAHLRADGMESEAAGLLDQLWSDFVDPPQAPSSAQALQLTPARSK